MTWFRFQTSLVFPPRGNTLLLVPSVVAVMTIVGLVAAVPPARRGMAVQPVEALRDE